MASPAAQLGALERAVQEVEALEAIYGFDAGGFTAHSPPRQIHFNPWTQLLNCSGRV